METASFAHQQHAPCVPGSGFRSWSFRSIRLVRRNDRRRQQEGRALIKWWLNWAVQLKKTDLYEDSIFLLEEVYAVCYR